MKKLNKVLFFCSAGLLALSVTSCKPKDVRNTSVPMGNLDTSLILASSQDMKVQNDVFYSRLRYKGYNTVLNQIKKGLFAEEYEFVKSQINLSDSVVNDYEQDLFDSYARDLFSTTSASAVEDYTEEERDKYIQKYIDSSNLKGIFLTKEQCLSYSSNEDKLKFTYIPQEVIDEKLITIAINKASKDALEKIVDSEKITDDDDKLVTNSNYISETNIMNYYDSHQKTYGTYRAIIIQFNNLNEARNVINAVETEMGASLNDVNALEFYVKLYNTYYNYRRQLDPLHPFENSDESSKTTFVVNKDKNELSEMSSSISNIVTNTLEEDGQYIKQPFNQNNKYIMVYRGATEFELNKTYNITSDHNEQVEWNELKEHEEAYKEVHAEVRDELIKNKVSSYSSTVLSKRVKNAEIEIYDPYFEHQFKNSYSDDYEFITPAKFNNNLIFKVTSKNSKEEDAVTEYSVENFYTEQAKISGLEIVVEQLRLEYAYNLRDKFLTDDQISDYEEELNKSISSFNKNENSSYPSSVGLELYLLGTFGYTNREDVLKYNKIGSKALTDYLNQTVFDEWALKNADGTYPEDHGIDYSKLNALDHILEAGNANYANLFSINIDHILIYIDDNGDGSPDDPKDFLKNFNEAEKKQFNQALLELSQAIYAEANCEDLTKSNTTFEILQYVVGAYNRNEPLFTQEENFKGKTWEDFKKYNFLLKAESLSSSGDTTQDNVGNYVKEFGDYIKELYKKAVENDLKIEDKKSIFYFIESLEKAPGTVNSAEGELPKDLCATSFGYHMIVVNEFDTPSTTKFTSSSDQYGYYKNIEILLNEMDADTTDDNIFVRVPDTYNENEKEATMNQLFTYYVQKQKGLTSSIDNTLREVLSSMFDSAITRYTSTAFQNYLLFDDLNIKIEDPTSTLAQQMKNYGGYLVRVSQDYATDDEFASWYDGTLDWSRPYNK